MLKKYQPERTDLWMNNDWAILHHDLAAQEAPSRTMLLYKSEKSAPLLFIPGWIGLYYLLRRTARRILRPQTGSKPVWYKKFRPSVMSFMGLRF